LTSLFIMAIDWESLNGTTRNQTDANIRRHFGTIDDFLLTSMASQMDSLSFVKEGSTKRKEILAKFLDLDLFDAKFKLAKKDLCRDEIYYQAPPLYELGPRDP
jgi:DNA repair exonuclease SbcCD ATPase subunit